MTRTILFAIRDLLAVLGIIVTGMALLAAAAMGLFILLLNILARLLW
jgi:type IV secretory pathway VirB2 component (pilin)